MGQIATMLENGPMYFTEIVSRFKGADFQRVTRAMGELHAGRQLVQDSEGRYSSPSAD